MLRELEALLIGRGPYAEQQRLLQNKSKYGSSTTKDFDFSSSSSQHTTNTSSYNPPEPILIPSYRLVPNDFNAQEFWTHAGQTTLKEERFEVDMTIESNSAMRKVEPYAKEVTMLRQNEEADRQPIGRLHYTLKNRSFDAKDLASTAQLYGDDNGEIVLQYLFLL